MNCSMGKTLPPGVPAYHYKASSKEAAGRGLPGVVCAGHSSCVVLRIESVPSPMLATIS